ncbi:hypothetical protein DFH11DRAFT_1625368 [Phellopilus nigrolimitatus]|nr:hypothetical protein DFH11DRAFT_1634584 [Phellopilus nigrolimitatus]KAH8109704.1 hypothetical protein DFH11DRAFT_1625368 [Phellopilus nigrolimitatus]
MSITVAQSFTGRKLIGETLTPTATFLSLPDMLCFACCVLNIFLRNHCFLLFHHIASCVSFVQDFSFAIVARL